MDSFRAGGLLVEAGEDGIALDLLDVLGPGKGRGRGLAGGSRPPDRLEEVLQPAGQEHPEHLEVGLAVVDDLVLVPGPPVGGRAGADRVLDAVAPDLARALAEDTPALLRAVLVPAMPRTSARLTMDCPCCAPWLWWVLPIDKANTAFFAEA